MSKKRGRRSLRTYLKLTLGAVILVGLNYVFTKLFDLLYGKTDLGYTLGIFASVLIFIGFFTVFLWWADNRGTLASMMGAKEES